MGSKATLLHEPSGITLEVFVLEILFWMDLAGALPQFNEDRELEVPELAGMTWPG